MKAIALLLLFIGMFLVTQGYYVNISKNDCPAPSVQIKYVPRSVYDEQLAPDTQDNVSKQFKSLFETIQPWPGIQQPIGIPTDSQQKISPPPRIPLG